MKKLTAIFSFLIAYLIYLYLISKYLIVEDESLFSVIIYSALLIILFVVVAVFFKYLLVAKKAKYKHKLPYKNSIKPSDKANKDTFDKNRRQFLKLAGSLGLSAFFLSLFSKKAQALQFGGTGIPDPIGVEPLGNSQTTGSTTLTDADTWYQVPSSNQANRVFIVLHNRSGYDMYWTFDNTVNASSGGMLFPSGGNLMLDAGNAVNVYARCGTAGQSCWYAESQSQ